MPDIVGSSTIKLQPETVNYPVSFEFSVCSAQDANDGNIPYGDTLSSAEVKAYTPDGTDETSSLVTGAETVNGNTVSCAISYYSGIPDGKHKLTVIYTCASGYVDEIDAARVFVEDR